MLVEPIFYQFYDISFYTPKPEIRNIIKENPVLYYVNKYKLISIEGDLYALLENMILTYEKDDFVLRRIYIEYDDEEEIQNVELKDTYYLSKVNILEIYFFEEIAHKIKNRLYEKELDKQKRRVMTFFIKIFCKKEIKEMEEIIWDTYDEMIIDLQKDDCFIHDIQSHEVDRRMISRIDGKYYIIQIRNVFNDDIIMDEIPIFERFTYVIKKRIVEYL